LLVQATASAFRFLRQPSRPKPPMPVAKSGRAAGSGVAVNVVSPILETLQLTVPGRTQLVKLDVPAVPPEKPTRVDGGGKLKKALSPMPVAASANSNRAGVVWEKMRLVKSDEMPETFRSPIMIEPVTVSIVTSPVAAPVAAKTVLAFAPPTLSNKTPS